MSIQYFVLFAELAVLPLGASMVLMYATYGECLRPLLGRLLRKRPRIPQRVDAFDFFETVAQRRKMPMNSEKDLQNCYQRCREVALQSWFRVHDIKTLERHLATAQLEMRVRSYFAHRSEEASAPPKVSGWRKILKLEASERDVKRIKTAYRHLVSKNHPDKGGDGHLMGDYNQALEAARSELKFV